MAFNRGPKIVTNGLVLYLDAANNKSYPGSGTVWRDLSGNSNHCNYTYNNGLIVYSGTTPNSYLERTSYDTNNDFYRSTNTVNLSNDFTMSCWCYMIEGNVTVNGIITNHDYGACKGSGINVFKYSATDYRMTCNTGDGTGRTYATYVATSNIYLKWSHLLLRYIRGTTKLSLWVNGVSEVDITIYIETRPDYIDLFNWSTTYIGNANYHPDCRLANVSIYNRALSSTEILQNYNTQKSRFGL